MHKTETSGNRLLRRGNILSLPAVVLTLLGSTAIFAAAPKKQIFKSGEVTFRACPPGIATKTAKIVFNNAVSAEGIEFRQTQDPGRYMNQSDKETYAGFLANLAGFNAVPGNSDGIKAKLGPESIAAAQCSYVKISGQSPISVGFPDQNVGIKRWVTLAGTYDTSTNLFGRSPGPGVAFRSYVPLATGMGYGTR